MIFIRFLTTRQIKFSKKYIFGCTVRITMVLIQDTCIVHTLFTVYLGRSNCIGEYEEERGEDKLSLENHPLLLSH